MSPHYKKYIVIQIIIAYRIDKLLGMLLTIHRKAFTIDGLIVSQMLTEPLM